MVRVVAKMEPRSLKFAHIARPRLDALLESASTRCLTLLTAPAGYGKTVTLHQWRESLLKQGHLVAWLQLEGVGDDPSVLAKMVQQSVSPQPPITRSGFWQSRIDAVIDAWQTLPGQFWLMLDDHNHPQREGIREVLSYLIDHAPDCLHVVISGRRRPRIPLARLRIARQLLELSQAELAFDIEESRRFLTSELAAELNLPDHEQIEALTLGWPAGLRLAASTLERAKRPKDALEELARLPAEFSEYFAECLKGDLRSDQLALLARTSMIDELSLPLCRAVDEKSDIDEVFDRLRSKELFARCVDNAPTRFQLHPQFRKYLHVYLDETLNEDGKLRNARASEWFAEKGEWQLAVQHAFLAGNTLRALAWARRCAREEVAKGNLSVVLGWLGQIPSKELMGDAALLAAAGTAYALSLRLNDARSIVGMIENRIAASPSDPDALELADYRKSLLIFIAYMSDDGNALLKLADEFRGSVSQDWSVLVVGNATIHGHLIAGDIELARGSLQPLPVDLDRQSLSFSIVCRSCLLALCDIAENRPDQAEQRLREALDLARRTSGADTAPGVLAASLLAFVRYQRNDLAEAESLLHGHLDLIEQTCFVEGLIACYLTVARLMVSRGNWKSASKLLERGEAFGRNRDWLRLRAACMAERIRLHLLQSQLTQARALLTVLRGLIQTTTPIDRSPASFAWRLMRMSEGRLLAAENKLQKAVAIFERQMNEFAWDEQAELEAGIEYAVVLEKSGNRGRAMKTIASLLERSQTGDVIRPYIDAGSEAVLLTKATVAILFTGDNGGASNAYLGKLASALKTGILESTNPDIAPAWTMLLTERERDLVSRLRHGMTNKEIAADLDIGLETVKWHLKAIFKKLRVRNRTEAASVVRMGVD